MASENQPEFVEHRSRKPAFKRLSTYLPALVVLGLAATVLIYLLSMQMLGWKTPQLGVKMGAATAVSSGPKNIYLYASPNTRNYFSTISGNYEVLVTPWRHYFAERGVAVSEIADATRLRDVTDGVLILPSALALSLDERNEIARFRQQGGNVLATWASGSRTEKGEWAGWQFLESLGAIVTGEVAQEPPQRYLVTSGESPVSYSSAAGQRIWLGNAAEKFLRLKPAGSRTAARIMDWARIPDHERREEGAVLFSEDGGKHGRTVLFAFAESAWESQAHLIYPVVDDALGWLQHQPAVVRAAWPDARQAAQVLEMDTEEGFPNATRFADMMSSLKYRGTFYVLTSVGVQHPEVLKSLARSFEIGYHADVHDSFKDQPAAQQAKRMETMKAQMASVLGDISKFTGFRAPTEGYDATTDKLLHQNGLRHHVKDPSSTEARLPQFVKLDGVASADALVSLPRTQRDDINLLKQNLNPEQMTMALQDDFDAAYEMGALGLLSVHSQNYGENSVLTQAMPAYLSHLKPFKDRLWLASAGEVAQWWRERDRFKLSVRAMGARQEINVSLTGSKPLRGAALIVMLPQKDLLPSIQALKVGSKKPTVRQLDPYRAALVFDNLEPGDYAYQATFD